MAERWLPVVGYEGSYEVSDLGNVRSLDRFVNHGWGTTRLVRGGPMKPVLNKNGYPQVSLSIDNWKQPRQIHRLVLEAFVGPRPAGLVACHGNGDRTDARLANLRWDTYSANAWDQVRHGTHVNAARTHCVHGHPYDEQNTRYSTRPEGGLRRTCRKCVAIRSRLARAMAAANR